MAFRADPDTFVATWVSDSAERMTGFPAATLLAQPDTMAERVHADDRAVVDRATERLRTEGAADFEYRWRRADGSWRWFLHRVVVARDADGRVTDVIGTVGDITDRKAIEEELRRTTANLEKAQQLAGVGSWEYDVASGLMRWSPQIYAIVGMDPSAGPPPFDAYLELVHPDDRERMRTLALAAIERGAPNEVEYRLSTPWGWRLLRSMAGPEIDVTGRVVRIHGALMDVTDQRAGEDRLRRSEATLSRAQQLARIGNWEYDPITGRVEWSEGMWTITGRDRSLGLPSADDFFRMVHPDDIARMRATGDEAFRSGRGYDTEYRLVTPRGAVYVRTITEVVEVEGRRVTRGTLIDLTESKLRELELRRSQASLAKAQELAHIGSWELVWPDDLRWSDEMFRITDRDPAAGAPKVADYVASVHSDDRAVMTAKLALTRNRGVPYDASYRIVGPRGVRYVHSLGEPRRDAEGRIVSMVGTLMDVTERVLVERALRESRERLDLALAGGRMGLWDWYPPTERIEWDARWAAMLGYTAEEMPGTYEFWRDHVHPDDIGRVEADLDVSLRGDGNYEVDYRMRTKSGTWIWTHARGLVSERGADGRPLRMTGIQFDVTARREAEEAARSAELRARRAEHLASIGTLAAGVAHELNNPLGGIVLAARWADRVLERGDPDAVASARDALGDVLKEATRGKQIVRNVLQFARAEATERELVSPRELVAGAVATVQAYAEERDSAIEIALQRDPPPVRVNPGEIHQVLVNLLRNALESRHGAVRVRVVGEVDDAAYALSVDDDGRGLSEHVRKHLFEPFFTTRRDHGGTGLGLSLSHGIVTQHGGSIEVGASPLGGTRFTVRLPLGDGGGT